MLKTPKIRSEKHRRWVSKLPCVLCRRPDVQAAHIRSGNGAGMGLKSGDDCVVPLCIPHHEQQHSIGEREFWSEYGGIEKATMFAKSLYENTGKNNEALGLIGEFR